MILQSLASFYDRAVRSPDHDIPKDGWNRKKAHFAIVIDKSGKLVQFLDLREAKGKKLVPRFLNVPQGPKKSVNIAANFLWGSSNYVLGADEKNKPERTANCHAAFKELHEKLLKSCSDPAAPALLAFLSSWNPSDAPALDYWSDMLKSNLVFQLDGDRRFIHERPQLAQVWDSFWNNREKGVKGMCLVTGYTEPIARLHPAIQGVIGAQSSGAALVSFNLNAFCSYDKDQNFNAPVSEAQAAAYTKALNYLLSRRENKVRIGDATTVFWTERESPVEGFFGQILDPSDTAADDQQLAVYLKSVRAGKLPSNIEGDVKFYILGLSPNAARISVRFWHMSTVEDISEKLGRHFRDLEMVRSYDNDPAYPGMWKFLKETTNKKSKDGPSPLLAGAVMQAIIRGTLYPQTLLSQVIERIRAEQQINYMRAAIIKAVLVRKHRLTGRGSEVSMVLDKQDKRPAYLLGRLFAVLEKAQQDAIPGANTTIKDRFYSSASATPRTVFPQLLRLAQHHIQKAKYGRVHDKLIEEIIGELSDFPPHLGLDQQGLFAIGYYHQRQDFYSKKISNDKDKE